jgi:hypothetical protein
MYTASSRRARVGEEVVLGKGVYERAYEMERTHSIERTHSVLGKGVYEWAYEQIYTERSIVHVILKNVFVSGNDGLVTDANRRVFATFHQEQVPYYANLPPPENSKSVHRFSKVLYFYVVNELKKKCRTLTSENSKNVFYVLYMY